jgi:hypothetical protein
MTDDTRELRARVESLEDALTRRGDAAPGRNPAQALRIKQGPGYVATAGRFFLGRRAVITAASTEGATATVAEDAGGKDWIVRVLRQAPVAGQLLLARATDHRWHAELGSGSSGDDDVSVLGCPCSPTPRRIRQISSHPLLNDRILQNATLVYGPTPPGLRSLGMSGNNYLSDTTFVDNSTGDLFRYYLFCYVNYYMLTRVYETSVYGSPFRDVVRYSWLATRPGNTCSPFAMNLGAIFAGGDATCVVTLDPAP